jgi:hypothetical protein
LKKRVVHFHESRKAHREDGKREQEHDDHRHAPEPPVPVFQFLQFRLHFEQARIRGGIRLGQA